MKNLLLILILSTIGIQTFASEGCMDPNQRRQRYLKSDHVSCRVENAKSVLEEMNNTHQTMTKKEIIKDIEAYIDNKISEIELEQRNADRKDRPKFDKVKESFLADANVFLNEVKKQESTQDILLLESDIVAELNEFDYSAYGDALSQVDGGEGVIVGLFFGAIIDTVSSPFQAINNGVQYSQTKWSRKLVSFIINY